MKIELFGFVFQCNNQITPIFNTIKKNKNIFSKEILFLYTITFEKYTKN